MPSTADELVMTDYIYGHVATRGRDCGALQQVAVSFHKHQHACLLDNSTRPTECVLHVLEGLTCTCEHFSRSLHCCPGTYSSRAMQTPGCTCTPTASQLSGRMHLVSPREALTSSWALLTRGEPAEPHSHLSFIATCVRLIDGLKVCSMMLKVYTGGQLNSIMPAMSHSDGHQMC
jgi:hypothetical protein